ncbi:hypothetical protein VQ056_12390 [Paenibacillus sp. JTLBN-2024]
MAGRNGELPYGQEHIYAMRFRILEEEVAGGEWLQLQDRLRLRWGAERPICSVPSGCGFIWRTGIYFIRETSAANPGCLSPIRLMRPL